MRIVLIGASGQLGRALTPALSGLGRLTCLTRQDLDLTDLEKISSVLRRSRPGLIINAAAYTNVDRAEAEEQFAAVINGQAPGAIAEAARANGAGLAHFSTDYVFDGAAATPYAETLDPNPVNVYGRSKLAGEKAIATSGASHIILRTSWVYGSVGSNFLKTILRQADENEEISVVDYQHGTPTSVSVLVDVVCRLVERMRGDPVAFLADHGGLVHAACGGETSWYGFAEAILDEAFAAGFLSRYPRLKAVSSQPVNRAAPRPAYSALDSSLLADRFGIATPDWRDALRAEIATIAGPS